MPRPVSKVDWRRAEDGAKSSGGRLIRRVVLSLILATLAGVLIWLLLPPNYPDARFVSLSVTEYDIELPPIAVFPEDIDRFEQSSYLGAFDRLDPLQTSEAIGRLGGRLRGIVSPEDTLILYVAAHGVSEKGVPYLLCSDFLRAEGSDSDGLDDSGRVELTQFLGHVVDCPAKLKLIVLDVGHIAADPRLGMVVNEFPRLLVEEVKKLDDPSLWVLSGSRSLETTHVSHAMRRSIFSHHVSLALDGEADKAGNEDGRVDLAELSRFVRFGVADWVSRQTDRASSQTPLLLKAGVGIIAEDDLTEPPFLQLASREEEGEGEGEAAAAGEENGEEDDEKGGDEGDTASEADTRQGHAVHLVRTVQEITVPTVGSGWLGLRCELSSNEPPVCSRREPFGDFAGGSLLDNSHLNPSHPIGTVISRTVLRIVREITVPTVGSGWLGLRCELSSNEPPVFSRREPFGDFAGGSLLDNSHLNPSHPIGTVISRTVLSYVQPSAETQPSEDGETGETSSPTGDDPAEEPENTPQPAESTETTEPAEAVKPEEPEEPVKPEEPEEADAAELNAFRLRQLLDDAWGVRDRMQVRGSTEPWSPVDYAPHLWREYQAILLGYELRYRRGSVLDEQKLAALEDLTRGGELASHVGRNTVLGRLADARIEFLRGDACRGFDQAHPSLEVVAEAVKLQNDLLFAMPYYVRWHAEHTRLASGDRSLGQTLTSLLDELADLIDLLESLSPARSPGAASNTTPRRLLVELTERTERLRALRDDVDRRHLAAEVLDLLDDPTGPGVTARIEAVLSTPLVPGPRRTRLLEVLEQTGQDTSEASDVSSRNRADDDSLAARKPTWDAVAEQAFLEAKLVLLADPEHRFSLSVDDFTRPRNHENEEKLWGEYRVFGAELGNFYRRLPARINALVEGESTQDAGRPQRLLRLVDARDVRRTLGRSLTAASFPAIEWPRLKTARPGLEAPATLTLVRDDWAPLEVVLEVTGGDAEEVSYRLDYNPAQVRVENVDPGLSVARGRWREASLGTVGRQTLHFRVRCEEEPRAFDPILAHLRVDDEETTHQIAPHLPSPDVVDLLIERITGTAATSAREADRFATVLVDQPEDDGAASLVRCRAFCNRSTEYRMALVNRSGRTRKVVVDLLTVRTRLAFDPSSRPEPFDRFGRLALGFTRLAEPLNVALPADDTFVPIPFPDPKAAEKGAPETEGDAPVAPKPSTPDASADTSGDGPLVTHGILCLMRDAESDAEWSRWIDFSPVAPREYLQADVQYSHARRRISIKLAPLAGSRVLPPLGEEEPIDVVWETAGVLPPGTRMKTATRLASVAHRGDLDAVINPDVTRSVEVRLSVNGYPRAFVFHAFATNRDKPRAEINGDLRRVEIVSPAAGDAFRVPLESPLTAVVRVDAPTDAFRKPGDVLEVGIDQNDDRSLGDDEKRDFFADRHVEIRLGRLDPGGLVEVFTLVRDFEVALDPAGLANTQVDIKADLRLNDRLEASDDVSVVLDGARPVFDRLIVPTRPVAHGAEVEVRARLSDTSGVEVVRFGFDLNNSNTLDDDEKLEELFHPNDGDAWRALLPTEDLKPKRTWSLIVVAVDRVGLDTKETRPVAIGEPVVPEPAATPETTEPPEPKNSVLRGRIYMNNPDERISWTAPDVWLEEDGRHAKPDSRGVFTFDDLPQGDYTLLARGMAGNRILEGEKKVTVTEKEAQVLIRMGRSE